MSLVLIGSQAAKINGIDLKRRLNVNEYDIIGTKEEMVENFGDWKALESKVFPGKYRLTKDQYTIEFDATGNPSNLLLMQDSFGYNDCNILGNVNVLIPDKQVLYLIKRSHANFSVHFEKTLHDLIQLSKVALDVDWSSRQEILDDTKILKDFYAARHNEAKERFGKVQDRIKLNKSNDQFFRGGSNLRIWEHDDVHKAVAKFPDFPMFLRCKWDVNSAKIERDLFERLHPKMQIWMVMEEAMVIGIERAGVTLADLGTAFYKESNSEKLYRQGLHKLTKDLCKGWFQDFILDNILSLLNPDWDYLGQFEVSIRQGKVNRAKKGERHEH